MNASTRAAVRRSWCAFKESGSIWRTRVRSFRYHRMASLAASLLALEVATLWVLWLGRPDGDLPLVTLLYGVVVATWVGLGALIVSLCVLYIYTYALIALQFMMPGLAALALSLLLAALDRALGFKRHLIASASWLYPQPLRESYVQLVQSFDPILTFIGFVSTAGLTVVGLWAQARLTYGLMRDDDFRRSTTFMSWTSPVDPMPTARSLFAGALRKLLDLRLFSTPDPLTTSPSPTLRAGHPGTTRRRRDRTGTKARRQRARRARRHNRRS